MDPVWFVCMWIVGYILIGMLFALCSVIYFNVTEGYNFDEEDIIWTIVLWPLLVVFGLPKYTAKIIMWIGDCISAIIVGIKQERKEMREGEVYDVIKHEFPPNKYVQLRDEADKIIEREKKDGTKGL